MDKFRECVTEVERRVSAVEDIQRDHHSDLHTLKSKVKVFEARTEDAENRNRRNNVRVLGLPQGAEGSDLVTFMEQLLPSLLPKVRFSSHYFIERANRMPATRGHRCALSFLNSYTTETGTRSSTRPACKVS